MRHLTAILIVALSAPSVSATGLTEGGHRITRQLLEVRAEDGDKEAMYTLAESLLYPILPKLEDAHTGLMWAFLAYDKGHPEAEDLFMHYLEDKEIDLFGEFVDDVDDRAVWCKRRQYRRCDLWM